MTPNKSPVKTIPFHYSKSTPKGWDFENGSVAFGETEKKEKERKE